MIIFSSVLIGILLVFLAKSYIDLARQIKLFRAEKQNREAILASLSDGILQYGADKKVIFMNPKAEEYFGVRQKDISDLKIVPDLWEDKPIYRALVEIIYPELAPFTQPRRGITACRPID